MASSSHCPTVFVQRTTAVPPSLPSGRFSASRPSYRPCIRPSHSVCCCRPEVARVSRDWWFFFPVAPSLLDKEEIVQAGAQFLFGPYRLDTGNEQLWWGARLLPLRPKPFALLRYLVERRGRLVPKAELLRAVWPDTVVSGGVLKNYIRDLRVVLSDDAEAPRFIETVARRGYRFIAAVQDGESLAFSHNPGRSSRAPSLKSQVSSLVGRERELAQLQRWSEKALAGERQVVFVTGEGGIGKTTLVNTFLEQLMIGRELWIGWGQCIEHFGVGEAYLPVLAALGQLCRDPGSTRLQEFLRQYAPSWLVQLPALLSAAELEVLQRKPVGATRERMLREMVEALEAVTAEQPLVLVLEDLHWSDSATLDLLAFVARRRQPARLLVIGTYRPVDMIMREHPLKTIKQELQIHKQCEELPLGLLGVAAVEAYLEGRFAGSRIPAALA